ncbi:type II toxin-antitoxin system VapC family toxin [Roseofilum reptotaenium CS-1145]|uniref:VapC toxin family PIN domain ribonuclease n=1 Tax=Roseofilum reptotaenium AO1-A TaxID=1925591 RepID=A0A1L9QJJ3_9CYAN|nr:type II toxin-antitoxin system VapC family toxin [Roseofilum reptotaenium]MDB9520076.1 type II toxin-antitoxin system VapC family toxin [Roseofilum reptotaenium CS-1145]OJJ14261.1 VapC toxin family PIN domain ribonuclease [Roseofilum reptotaenium AO1-A]
MIVLDTNIISELMRPQGNVEVYQWVSNQPISNLFTTTITQAEVLYGIALLPSGKRKNELSQAAQLMFQEEFPGRILPFDEKAAISFAQIATQRRRMGKPISQADAQIASICNSFDILPARRFALDGDSLSIQAVSNNDNCLNSR